MFLLMYVLFAVCTEHQNADSAQDLHAERIKLLHQKKLDEFEQSNSVRTTYGDSDHR